MEQIKSNTEPVFSSRTGRDAAGHQRHPAGGHHHDTLGVSQDHRGAAGGEDQRQAELHPRGEAGGGAAGGRTGRDHQEIRRGAGDQWLPSGQQGRTKIFHRFLCYFWSLFLAFSCARWGSVGTTSCSFTFNFVETWFQILSVFVFSVNLLLICFVRTVWVWFDHIWLTVVATKPDNLTAVVRLWFKFCTLFFPTEPASVKSYKMFLTLSFPRRPGGRWHLKKLCRGSVNTLKLPSPSEEPISLQAKSPRRENAKSTWLLKVCVRETFQCYTFKMQLSLFLFSILLTTSGPWINFLWSFLVFDRTLYSVY